MNLEAALRAVGSHFLRLSDRMFVYGPQGKLLLRNLEEHWFEHCVTMPHYNVFPCDVIADTLQLLRSNLMDKVLPFALATLTTSKSMWNESLLPVGSKVSSHRTAKINVFVDASNSKSLLHKKQRERKVWWRKLAQHPSRFVLAEAKKTRNLDVTEIEAQFPFGNIIVETIIHYPSVHKLYPQADDNKNAADIHMIEHVTSLDWGCLALLCDSYMLDKSNRAYIHPKLSPYKITFHIANQESETDSDIEDLNRFVLYLSNIFRTKGISTILINTEQIIETCLIPYVVLVDKTSLKNGIVHVKNRSTTFNEAVHITDLVKYISLRSS